jgi:hypothetical protein
MFYLSSAATIPATGVNSRRPDLPTSDLHLALFRGSLYERLRVLKSSFMHCEQEFLGHPCFPGQMIFILVIGLMNAEECITVPPKSSDAKGFSHFLYPQSRTEQCSGSLLTWFGPTDPADHYRVISAEPL